MAKWDVWFRRCASASFVGFVIGFLWSMIAGLAYHPDWPPEWMMWVCIGLSAPMWIGVIALLLIAMAFFLHEQWTMHKEKPND